MGMYIQLYTSITPLSLDALKYSTLFSLDIGNVIICKIIYYVTLFHAHQYQIHYALRKHLKNDGHYIIWQWDEYALAISIT